MTSILNWVAEIIGTGVSGISGGNGFVIVAFAFLSLAFILWRANVSMPFALMASFLVLGVLSQTLNFSFDPILGTQAQGLAGTGYLLLVFGSGVLMWHLFFKKSQAGVG